MFKVYCWYGNDFSAINASFTKDSTFIFQIHNPRVWNLSFDQILYQIIPLHPLTIQDRGIGAEHHSIAVFKPAIHSIHRLGLCFDSQLPGYRLHQRCQSSAVGDGTVKKPMTSPHSYFP